MKSQGQINRASRVVLIVLSLIALTMVVTGYFQPPQADEGAAAHIFQMAVAAFALMIVIFLSTADWQQPLRVAQRLVIPGAALVLAFGGLYYLEHIHWR